MAVQFQEPMDLQQLHTDDSVITFIDKVSAFAEGLPYIGNVLSVINSLRQEESRDAFVTQWFEKLSEQLQQGKRELGNMIKMEALKLRYGEHVVSIQAAFRSYQDIQNARDEKERQTYLEIFKHVCDSQKHAVAVDNLIEGLRDEGTLQTNILDLYYAHTGGHLQKVKSLANELLQLVYGGFIVIYTYENMTHGKTYAKTFFNKYHDLMEEVNKNIQNVFGKCNNNFRENMMRDLNEILDSCVSNREAVNSLSSLMTEKYDWLENYCVVSKECKYMDYCFKRKENFVSSSGRNGRFGVVFYQDRTDEEVNLTRPTQIKIAIESLSKLTCSADKLCDELHKALLSKGIKVYGCAVIGPKFDLKFLSPYAFFSKHAYHPKLETLQERGSSSDAVHYWQTVNPLRRPVLHSDKTFWNMHFTFYYLVLWK